MNELMLRNRVLEAASRGNRGAQALVRAFGGGGVSGFGVGAYPNYAQGYARQPGFGPGNAGLGGFGVGRHAMAYGRSAGIAGSPGFNMGSVAGFGVGFDPNNTYGPNIPAGGGISAPAASPLMGGFAPDPSMVQVGWIDPNVVMGAPLGFDSGGTTLVAAAAQFQLTSRPQEIFRGERFLIGSDIAPSLVVSDLKVGNRSQLINATNVPGMAFANTTIGASLRFETAQPGQDIVWTGVNIAGTPLRVLGCLVGSAAVRK